MNQVTTVIGSVVTMSSQEIAELTGKDHDNVRRDIRNMAKSLSVNLEEKVLPSTGGRPSKAYMLERREVEILLTGYSIPMRAAVIDRWHVLEGRVAKPQFQVPTTLHGALLLAANLEEQRAALTLQVETKNQKIAEDEPKVKVFNKLIDSTDLLTFQQFCTNNNLHQRKVKGWLREIGWVRESESDRNPLPTAKAVDGGYCDTKKFVTSSGRLKQQILFTGKAEAYVVLKAPDSIRKPVRKSKAKKAE